MTQVLAGATEISASNAGKGWRREFRRSVPPRACRHAAGAGTISIAKMKVLEYRQTDAELTPRFRR